MNFTDADGNMSGGSGTVTATFDQTTPAVVTFPIPSAAASITGTTAGTITLFACVTFGSSTTLTEVVRVADASGKVSNELSVTISRPAGAPELPTSAPAPMWSIPDGG